MTKMRQITISLLIFASGFSFVQCSEGDRGSHFPRTLGNLALSRVVKGEQATRIINNMHGKILDECENYIVFYGGGNSKNTLYVSVYENDEIAKSNLTEMAMKMAKRAAVFSPLTHSKMGKIVCFQTEGMGLKHYFYRVDALLVWLQVEPGNAKPVSDDLFNFDFASLKADMNL